MNPDLTALKIEELLGMAGLKSDPPEIPVSIFVKVDNQYKF
jgi:hypothetical protein